MDLVSWLLEFNNLKMNFKIIKQSKLSKARLGLIQTNRGVIETPFFMPDATRAVIKNTSLTDIEKLSAPALVINTLHLYLSPGLKIIKRAGGVNRFMDWSGPLLSDSGGYQVFSLIYRNHKLGKILNDRVIFKSPLDGSAHDFSSEKSIRIQFDLGASMIVCLDDCPPNDLKAEQLEQSVERTINWAKRCKVEYERLLKLRKVGPAKRPLLFAVIQGGANLKLRRYCASELIKIGFDGYGFGARPVDSQGKLLTKVLSYTADLIPERDIRFGLGMGMPDDIVTCVTLGWDMFDCVIPTREGRHGKLFLPSPYPLPLRTSRERGARKKHFKLALFSHEERMGEEQKMRENFYYTININNAKFKDDFSPININSKLPELRQYCKAYLHHLFKINEPLGARLASLNNFEFYLELMAGIRRAIKNGNL